MVIGSADKVTTNRLEKQMQRKVTTLKRNTVAHEQIPSTTRQDLSDKSSERLETDTSKDSSSDEEYQPLTKKTQILKTSTSTQMRTSLVNTAKAADLTGASNRTVAKIVNAVLQDLNVISAKNGRQK